MTTQQVLSIVQYHDLQDDLLEFISEQDESTPFDVLTTQFYEQMDFHDLSEDDQKVLALMQHTGDCYEDAEHSINTNYSVLTDDEADEAEEMYYQWYLEDIILPDIPESVRQYFNEEEWIKDAKRYESRGAAISSYDGAEEEEMIGSTTYYIYRI